MPTVAPHVEHETASKKKTHTPWTRIDLRDIDHPGTQAVLTCPSLALSTLISKAIHTVRTTLDPHHSHGLAPVRSVTLVFRPMDGVAYTTGKDFDDQHKEIHFSTNYIAAKAAGDAAALAHEIIGVVTHEMVHVWQFNGQGKANGGLIEGLADWVRLRAGLAPPHWRRVVEGRNWDSGYDTTAFFLDWLERKYGAGTVPRINQRLREKYDQEEFWRALFGGRTVDDLWRRYKSEVEHEEETKDTEKQDEVPSTEDADGTSSESLQQWELVDYDSAMEDK